METLILIVILAVVIYLIYSQCTISCKGNGEEGFVGVGPMGNLYQYVPEFVFPYSEYVWNNPTRYPMYPGYYLYPGLY